MSEAKGTTIPATEETMHVFYAGGCPAFRGQSRMRYCGAALVAARSSMTRLTLVARCVTMSLVQLSCQVTSVNLGPPVQRAKLAVVS